MILFPLVSVFAQTITLDEAVIMTLKTSPDLAISAMRFESAAEEAKAIKASLYPQISANADYFPTKTFVTPANRVFFTQQKDSTHVDISASYQLWDFDRTKKLHQSSLFSKDGAGFDNISTQSSIVEQVWNRYFIITYLKSIISTAKSSVKFYTQQYAQAVRMRETGLKTVVDESRFLASKTEAEDRLTKAQTEYDKAFLALGLLIGQNESFSIDENDFDRKVQSVGFKDENSLEVLRRELTLNSPQLKALHASVDSLKAFSEAADVQQYGTLSLVASYGHDNSISAYDSSQIGVKGTIPLYEGGKLSAESQKSKIALLSAQKAYDSKERVLWQELFDAYSDFKRSDMSIASKERVIDATKKAVDLTQGRYAQGLSTYVDVLESQSILENAYIEHADAKYTKLRTWAQIQRLLNKGCDNEICKK